MEEDDEKRGITFKIMKNKVGFTFPLQSNLEFINLVLYQIFPYIESFNIHSSHLELLAIS